MVHGEAAEPVERQPSAVVHWLAGAVFGMLVAVAIVLGADAPVVGGLFRSIETAGIDVAMNVRSRIASDVPIGDETSTNRPGYVFLDLDETFCQRVERSSWCQSRSPASPAAAALAAMAAIQAGARLVVIDVRLWDLMPSGNTDQPYLAALGAALREENARRAEARRPPLRVLAVAPTRAVGSGDQEVIEPSMIQGELAKIGVVFAPAYARSNDGIIRDYPAVTTLAIAQGSPGRTRRTPSLPYLAALYDRCRSDVGLTQRIDRIAWSPTTDWFDARAKSNAKALTLPTGDGVRPLFTLRTLALADPATSAGRHERFLPGFYNHYRASEVVEASGSKAWLPNPDLVRDRVIVIGASARVAMDIHPTPIGQMTGAEVIINMIRAFSTGEIFHEPSPIEKIVVEWIFVWLGSLPFLFYWWASSGLKAQIRLITRSQGTYPNRLLMTLPDVILFPITFVASAGLMISVMFAAAPGNIILNIFTPLLSLSLESFAHASIAVINGIELVIEWAFRVRRRGAATES